LNDLIINSSTLNIDASASYKINDNFSVTFDGINLTNQASYQYAALLVSDSTTTIIPARTTRWVWVTATSSTPWAFGAGRSRCPARFSRLPGGNLPAPK
jgi:outer membrane receptor protein involved in Fe transport